jgi:Initiator Replication protein.
MLRHMKTQLESGVQVADDGFMYLPMADLNSSMGYELNRKDLKKDLEEIRRQSIVLNYLGKDGKPVTHGIGFISEWKVTSSKVGFKVSDVISNALLSEESNKMFLLMDWQIFNSFNGKHEGIIYKLCKDYENIGKTPYFTLEHFKGYMGFEPNEYAEFRLLNDKVLKPCVNAINTSEKSDLSIQVEFERSGRKVVGLHFEITPKFKKIKQKTVQAPVSTEPNEQLQEAFSEARIEPSETLKNFINTLTVKQIKFCITEANKYIDNQQSKGKTADCGSIYYKALKENWGLKLEAAEAKKEQERLAREEQEKQAAIQKELDEKKKQQKKKVEDDENQMLLEFISHITDEQKEMLFKAVRECSPMKVLFSKWLKEYGDKIVIHPALKKEFLEQIELLFS